MLWGLNERTRAQHSGQLWAHSRDSTKVPSSHLSGAVYLAQSQAYSRCSINVNGKVLIWLIKQLSCPTWLQMTSLHQGTKSAKQPSPKFKLWATWETHFSVSQGRDWGGRKHLAKWTNGFREKGALLCGDGKKLSTAGFHLGWKKIGFY